MTPGNADDFAEIAASLHDTDTFEETLDKVLEFALKAVGGDYAGVLFVRRGRVETIAATSPVVSRLDQLQMHLDDGPDVALTHDRRSVLVRDTSSESRWPRWAQAAAQAGVRSMIGARLYVSGDVMGSLNVYAERPGNFNEDDQAVAQVLARHAAIALSNVEEQSGLLRALDSRKLIGIAEGILMERFGLNDDQAFGVLRRYSQTRNIKLRDVAQIVVDTRRLPD
ncbi:MAG TPA: GAF and ANTAR domain-containing protein [Nocardioides sp.]|uniref:GAF and ANTAR domain-containing protein n=1 Tax=Nocardioides sp. TaxID=35761 RepID=UPI002F40E9CD